MARWTRRDRDLQSNPWWFVADAVLAAIFTWITVVSLRSEAYVDQYGPVVGAGWLLALAPNALLLVRRLFPVTSLVAATVLYLVASATQGDSNAPLAIPFFAYSVAVSRPARVSATIVAAAAVALSTATFYGPGEPDPLIIVVWFLLFGLGWLVGTSIHSNQVRTARLARTVDDLEARRDEVAAAAIAEERSRLARELHDAVGHAVNVMVLQAGAARLSRQPDKAFDALTQIETIGRDALTDLDHMLGLLNDPKAAERSPVKGIADIEPMVAELNRAGADITLRITCDQPVGRHVAAAAFRIVQESLTNALKHAGPTHVDVTVSCTRTQLRMLVTDDGTDRPAQPPGHGGRGIVGMTERAKILGGRLQAGPREPRGFAVEAIFPLELAQPTHIDDQHPAAT